MSKDLPTRARTALRRLYEQGRIASPWMAGMCVRYRWADSAPDVWFRGRVLGDDGSTDQGVRMGDPASYPNPTIDEAPLPDDPAARGCLLALVREASEDPYAAVFLSGWERDREVWVCTVGRGMNGNAYPGPTEAEALVCALETLAGGR